MGGLAGMPTGGTLSLASEAIIEASLLGGVNMNWRVLAAMLLVAWHVNGEEPPKADNAVADIPVVARYEDLLSLPPSKLEGGATARFGIEAKACPRWSGVLFYCLTEGYDPPVQLRDYERLCGPLRVEAVRQGDAPKARDAGVASRQQRVGLDAKKAKLLFLKTLAFGSSGQWVITVSGPQGGIVAKTILEVAEKEWHPWVRLGRPEAQQDMLGQLTEEDGREHATVAHAAVVGDGAAIPYWSGLESIVAEGPGKKLAAGEKLPKLIPDEADPGLKLSVLKDEPPWKVLSVSGEKEFVTCRPDWHFIARWWINGKPFMPQAMKDHEDANGLVLTGKKLHLNLEFHPERLGAKRGDKIGVQLLYCAPGWSAVGSTQETLHVSGVGDEGEPVRITNRVEFEAR